MNAREAGSALRHARHTLTERGEIATELIDELVARSWQRCVQNGLAPAGRLPEVPHLSASELARATEREHELIANARPVMEYVFAQTRNSGSVVILADARGMLLQTLGDPDFLVRANRVVLAPGASWNERYRGTNAIGTALAENIPVVVHGAEHYLERNGFLTCAAAPIVAPDGRVLGVLDISGEQKSRHPHTFGLVRAAAQMIENRLFDVRHGDGLRLRFHTLAEGIGTVAEGVAALSDDGWIVGANQAGLALLGLTPSDLGATPLTRVLGIRIGSLIDWATKRPGEVQWIERPHGGPLFVRIEASRRPIAAAFKPATVIPNDALARLDTGDASMRETITRARRILGKAIPVLIQGESGVGKELFAKAMHDSAANCPKPFVAVNCTALPESLIEAELFGYEPGAFTGARREGMAGRIREAHGGTLFLDEIGDMPLAMQGRLLRVLQERKVSPLGGGKAAAVEFNLLCATNRDLKKEIEAGRFRADLYYRINGLSLTLPALRDRSDFHALVVQLIEEAAPSREIGLDTDVLRAFCDFRWPGNLRQLANAMRTACALLDEGERTIRMRDLSDDLVEELHNQSARPEPPPSTENLRALSESMIEHAIHSSGGNMSDAAKRLGISRNTLYRKLRRSKLRANG